MKVKRFLVGVVFVLFLSGCGDTNPHVETIDGIECMISKDGFGKIMTLDCNWEHRNAAG